jgi:aldose sugar dehydrogenase
MRKAIAIALLMSAALLMPSPTATALPPGTKIQLYKGGLNNAVDFAWVPGTKKFFYTEKNTGRIRVMVRGRILATPCRDLAVYNVGESGALGIILHPRFKDNHLLYVYFSALNPRENRVMRFKVVDNRCINRKLIAAGLGSSNDYHQGGQLEFMGGKLFVSVGEAHNPSNAQDTSNPLGKVLRLNPDGSVPSGNPFGNRIWSYGHRNGFGLAVRHDKGWLFESENGPNCDDELNRIVKGGNYGWSQLYQCGTSPGRDPLFRWGSTIAPTDMWWYRGRMNSLSNRLYMTDHNTGRLHKFRLNSTGTRVIGHAIVANLNDNLWDVTKGPRGWLYVSSPSAIYRIVPN